MRRFFGIAAACVGLDQLSKFLITQALSRGGVIDLIPGVFRLVYVENRGAAFSILSGQRTLLLVVTCAALIGLIVYRLRAKNISPLLDTAFAFLLGGGLGNVIDRARMGYVVDFFDVYLVDFAIFNVADIFVVAAAALLIIIVLRTPRGDNIGNHHTE